MRKLSLAAFFCISLATGSGVVAMDWMDYPYYDIVYSVDGWQKIGPRADGKLDAGSFYFTTQAPTPTVKATIQNFELRVPLGDPVALFMRNALEGRALKTVLVEAFPKSAKPAARAPFAVRLSDVRVGAVSMDLNGGYAGVTLQASKIEVFTATQSATGAMQPGQQLGWDIKAGKGM
jgi:hypothetical protein